eukprot:Gregarina_sp_Pseudo_9__4445@NODE_45_length_5109_cov_42_945957_g42_i0_p5_GENE_NODE_45_length_5109_cov_42_945957_g42_i0NODE_45_length_5109_cov_42_945957_g42_i0_p5_ORF_typecomplete_len137_score1_18RNA_POL_M_15KD/PF02150_16/9e11RNA_POL_M_15KD/PF02150_16/4_6e02RNA_POL_M_15KD/PF02150_16/2_6e02TFIIS_C/PF01096_18/1_6e03TFIIS_C/PF01096_18/2_1e02TFIIS_C/PF01096_18/1_1e10zinc_ribbon_10/PF10058_9/2e03zinc_ribbon_10/PF10058_9/4_6zinc_ribbon_10/PF10058_9/1_7e02zinc_ribbon_10/PF10058_9/1_9zfPHDlike/PF15446_6/0
MSSNLQFCKECRNLLQPKEDKASRMLMLICRTCNHVDYANQNDPSENCVESQNYNFRSAEDVNSHILPGLDKDPTLPRSAEWQCSSCERKGAVYFQLPERVADDAMTLVYVCVHCTFYEVKGKIADDEDDGDDAYG